MIHEIDMNELMRYTDLPGTDGEDVSISHAPVVLNEVESNPSNRAPDLESDYTVVRKSLHFQQQMLMNAAEIFLETAKNSDSPRHMEVFATLIGQMTTTNKEILKLHKEMKDITSETVTASKGAAVTDGGAVNQQLNINNAQVFLGGPTELMDSIGDAFEVNNKDIE